MYIHAIQLVLFDSLTYLFLVFLIYILQYSIIHHAILKVFFCLF